MRGNSDDASLQSDWDERPIPDFKIDKVEEGVWVIAEHPETGKKISVFVNFFGSSEGLSVDIWREGVRDSEVQEALIVLVDSIDFDWSSMCPPRPPTRPWWDTRPVSSKEFRRRR